MFIYNFTKFVAAGKLQTELVNLGLSTVSYIDTVGSQVVVHFTEELSPEQQSSLEAAVTAHNILSQEEAIRNIIRGARSFGNQIIEDFAVQNIMLGITQDGKTGQVRKACSEVIDCLVTGSLYDAINEIKAIPVESRDVKYLTPARLTTFCNRIETYLGLPLSTIT